MKVSKLLSKICSYLLVISLVWTGMPVQAAPAFTGEDESDIEQSEVRYGNDLFSAQEHENEWAVTFYDYYSGSSSWEFWSTVYVQKDTAFGDNLDNVSPQGRLGYAFEGWFTDGNSGSMPQTDPLDENTIITEARNYYAYYTQLVDPVFNETYLSASTIYYGVPYNFDDSLNTLFTNAASFPEGAEIDFSSSDETVATVSADGSTITTVKPGSCNITATLKSKYGNTLGSASHAFTVEKRPIKIEAGSLSKVYDGIALTEDDYTVYPSNGTNLVDGLGLASGDAINEVTMTAASTITNVGSCDNVIGSVTLTGDKVFLDYYDPTYVNGTLTVTQRPIKLQSAGDSKVYDGTALTKNAATDVSLVVDDTYLALVDGHTVVPTITGTQTAVGDSDNTFTAMIEDGEHHDLTANYNIEYVFGTLSVTLAQFEGITSSDFSGTYDGNSKSFYLTGVPDGATVKYRTSESGEYDLTEKPGFYIGNHTVYWQVTKSGYTPLEGSANVNIAKATATAAADGEAEGVVTVPYDGDLHGISLTVKDGGQNVVAPAKYTVYFGTTAENCDQSSLTYAEVGEYPIFYKVVSDYYNDITGSTILKIGGQVAVAQTPPVANNRDYNGNEDFLVTLGLTADGNIRYTLGTSTAPDTTGWGSNRPKATNAGTYYVWYYVRGDENHSNSEPICIPVTISKVAIDAATTAPTAINTTYNGSAKELVNPGSNSQGTMYYQATDTNDQPATTTGFSTSIPTRTNAGTYYVWYYIKGDSNHLDSSISASAVTVTISPKMAAVTTTPAANTLSYTGASQTLITAGVAEAGTLYYRLGAGGVWSTSLPSATGAGTYDVYYYVNTSGLSNYTDNGSTTSPLGPINVTISRVDPSVTTPTAKTGLVYNGSSQVLVNYATSSDGTVKYSLGTATVCNNNWYPDASQTEAGTYYVWYKVTGDSNHNDLGPLGPVQVTIAQASPSYDHWPDQSTSSLTYDGTNYNLMSSLGSDLDSGTWYYAVSPSASERPADSAFGTGNYYKADAGTWYVWCKYVPTSGNYSTVVNRADYGPVTISLAGSSFIGSFYKGFDTRYDESEKTLIGVSPRNISLDPYDGYYTIGGTLKYKVEVFTPEVGELYYDRPDSYQKIVSNGSGGYRYTGTAPAKDTDDWISLAHGTSYYASNLPKATEARIYIVWYYVDGDPNHSDTAVSNYVVEIPKSRIVITANNVTIEYGENWENYLNSTVTKYTLADDYWNPNDYELLKLDYGKQNNTHVGTYTYTPALPDSERFLYNLNYQKQTYNQGTITIVPAPLTVTAGSFSKMHGIEDVDVAGVEFPNYTYWTATGFKYQESKETLTAATAVEPYTLKVKVDRAEGEDYGNYAITAVSYDPNDPSRVFSTYRVYNADHSEYVDYDQQGDYYIIYEAGNCEIKSRDINQDYLTAPVEDNWQTYVRHDLVYDGEDQDLLAVKPTYEADDVEGKIRYYVSETEINPIDIPVEGWTDAPAPPMAMHAGHYYVYYYVDNSDNVNYDDLTVTFIRGLDYENPLEVDIAKAPAPIIDDYHVDLVRAVDSHEFSGRFTPEGSVAVDDGDLVTFPTYYSGLGVNYEITQGSVISADGRSSLEARLSTLAAKIRMGADPDNAPGKVVAEKVTLSARGTTGNITVNVTTASGTEFRPVDDGDATPVLYEDFEVANVNITFSIKGQEENDPIESGEMDAEFIDDIPTAIIGEDADGNPYGYKCLVYDGTALTPEVIVRNGTKTLTKNVDYTISYKNNKKANALIYEVRDPENNAPYTIVEEAVYDDDDNIVDYKDEDYNAILKKKGKNVTLASVIIKGKGNYTGTKVLYFIIAKADIANAQAGNTVVTNGKKAAPILTYKGSVLKKGTHYTANLNKVYYVGGAHDPIIITGKGNFAGTKEVDIEVAATYKKFTASLASGIDFTYNAEEHYLTEDQLIVRDAGSKEVLHVGTDYKLSYSNAVNAGTVKVTITGSGLYKGKVTKSYKIKPAKDAQFTVTNKAKLEDVGFTYSKAGVTPPVYVTADIDSNHRGVSLVAGRDYKVTYSQNKKVGYGKATITFMGNFKGAGPEKGGKAYQYFKIKQAELDDGGLAWSVSTPFIFSANKKTFGSYKLTTGKNFVVTYNNIAINTKDYTIEYYSNPERTAKLKNSTKISNKFNEEGVQTVYVRLKNNSKNKNYKNAVIDTIHYDIQRNNSRKVTAGRKDVKVQLINKNTGKVASAQYTGQEIEFDPTDEDNDLWIMVTVGSGKKREVYIWSGLGEADPKPAWWPTKYYKGDVSDHFNIDVVNNTLKGTGYIILESKLDSERFDGSKIAKFKIVSNNVKNTIADIVTTLFMT
ncbi:hypothetical protein [Butyrivibrio sp. MC2013]|uniref:hypothetical protein n=1 Tax=Butyrivibrio sp. MC2013 TaxID=1280686 RepID=UPI0003FCFDE5|nr:hypothetical protein [Butyrivibrio sp. MC2013]